MIKKTITILCLFITIMAYGQTIAEKKAGLNYVGSDLSEEMQNYLNHVNKELEALQKELLLLHAQAEELYQQNAPEEQFREILDKINLVKQQMTQVETQWREKATQQQQEGYALWHQPSTTLEQLVIDYGSQSYVYLIPPDVGTISVSIDSNLAIPRASWNEMLEIILAQNGIGIRQLNPFLRQLYLIRQDPSGLKLITNNRKDLAALADSDRVAFMLSPEPSDVRRAWFFLERFANPNTVVLQQIGRDILIIAQVSELQELLKLYDFVAANRGTKEYKIVPLNGVDAGEMAKILGAIFGITTEDTSRSGDMPRHGKSARPMPPLMPQMQNSPSDNGLQVIALEQVANAVFLIGTREEIHKAESVIQDVQAQVGQARGKEIYWYTVKHSDPEELAQVLEKIYYLMIEENITAEEAAVAPLPPPGGPPGPPPPSPIEPTFRRPYEEPYFLDDRFVVNALQPRLPPPPPNVNRDNFIVDPKTGSIAMVVEVDILPKLKDLIKKLDVPKKMVQIEVLLFEKKIFHENSFGLNLLRIGSKALNKNISSVVFNDIFPKKGDFNPLNSGIFEFMFSRKKRGSAPAYDLSYKFLLSQQDVRINASPSVLAINQTEASIEIAEEISVNTGIFEIPTTGDVTLKQSFARAQYGIIINVTPTIHTSDHEDFLNDCPDYVTLATDLMFQTIRSNVDNRPDVTTRHVINEVNIPDGQTVIIGGLRQKASDDNNDAIPFLGELPGIGKLFSITEMKDQATEMFIFITPKIIHDPIDELERIKLIEMTRRPGDIPEFLCALASSQEWEHERLMYGTMAIFFGRPDDNCYCPQGEYDGR